MHSKAHAYSVGSSHTPGSIWRHTEVSTKGSVLCSLDPGDRNMEMMHLASKRLSGELIWMRGDQRQGEQVWGSSLLQEVMRLGETVTLSTERRLRFENCCRVDFTTLRGMKNKEEGVVRYSVDLGDKKQKNGGHRGAHAQAVGKHWQGQVWVEWAQGGWGRADHSGQLLLRSQMTPLIQNLQQQ